MATLDERLRELVKDLRQRKYLGGGEDGFSLGYDAGMEQASQSIAEELADILQESSKEGPVTRWNDITRRFEEVVNLRGRAAAPSAFRRLTGSRRA